MSVSTRVFLGDLVRALSIAGAEDTRHWPAIANMLGFHQGERDVPARLDRVEEDRPLAIRLVEGVALGDRAPAAAEVPHYDGIGDLIEYELERSTSPAEQIELELGSTIHSGRPVTSPLPFHPLFESLWERGILIEAAGMPGSEGELAVLRAVELIARGIALRELPVEKVQSVSKGCQVLMDTGFGMAPFARDGIQIVRSLRKAVGTRHTQVLTFVDCPTVRVMTEAYEEERYAAPENGAMVLAISDLCQGGPRSAIREAEPEDWLTLAKWVHDAGSLLVVLNPYPPDRWPASVAKYVPIVHWDATTRAANVRRVRRRFRR